MTENERRSTPHGRWHALRERMAPLLDDLVRNNRATIALLFPAVGGLLLVGSAAGHVPAPLAFNPWLVIFGVLVMRLPLVAGVLPLADRRFVLGIGLLTAYTYAIELVGLATGWPYGQFEYGVSLGPMLGGVPLALPILFIPLVVNAYLLGLLLLGRHGRRRLARLAAVIPLVLLIDVVLDPGAVALGFWAYDPVGPFYGVPWMNYGGWLLSAIVGVLVLDAILDRDAVLTRLETCSYMLDDVVSFVILWATINIWAGNLLPVLVCIFLGVGLLRTRRFDASFVRDPLAHL